MLIVNISASKVHIWLEYQLFNNKDFDKHYMGNIEGQLSATWSD